MESRKYVNVSLLEKKNGWWAVVPKFLPSPTEKLQVGRIPPSEKKKDLNSANQTGFNLNSIKL
jgi:hypothetical protein